MKRKVIIALLVMSVAILTAIDFINTSGNDVEISNRDSLAFYHTNTDDQHWYGAESWAVKFEFNSYYENIDSLRFKANSAYVYIPNDLADDEITINLCEDDYSQPDLLPNSILISETFNPEFGWNEITFPEIIDTTFWLVVDYPTNTVDKFVSASYLDGSHSYYLQDGYFFNMAQNGFISEFLFSLGGTFIAGENDLELVDFDLRIDENYYPNGMLDYDAYPYLIVKNNSETIADSIFLNLRIVYPQWSIIDTLDIPDLQPDETIIIDYFQDHHQEDGFYYNLLRSHSQYKVYATLEYENDDFSSNNNKEFYLNIFPLDPEKILIENFISLSGVSSEIWDEQTGLVNLEDSEVINYFPNISDSLYNSDSVARFNFYNLSGNPSTIVGGENVIFGFDQTYSDKFSSFYQNYFAENKTYISEEYIVAELRFDYDASVDFGLKNENTYIFDNYLEATSFYVAVVEDNVEIRDNIFGSVLLDVYHQVSNPSLNANEMMEETINFNWVYDIEMIGSSLYNIRFVYWVQNDETKKIDFLNSIDFYDFEFVKSTDDFIEPDPYQMQISPNPFRMGQNTSFILNRTVNPEKSKLSVYNIKGQLVRSIQSAENGEILHWNGKDSKNRFVSSGIYLLKAEILIDGEKYKFFRNCLFLK